MKDIKEPTPHSVGPGQQHLEPGKVLFGAMLGSFGMLVGCLGRPKRTFPSSKSCCPGPADGA